MITSCSVNDSLWSAESAEGIWAYLLENGEIALDQNKRECLEEILLYDIDWDRTRIPNILTSKGTEEDNFEDFIQLRGTLVTTSGKEYTWVSVLNNLNTNLNSCTEIETIIKDMLYA